MRKAVYVYIFSLMVLGSIIFMGCSQKAQEGTILAQFDRQVVTLEELEKDISEFPEWKQSRYQDKESKEEYLNEVVEKKLISLAAIDKGLDRDPKIIRQSEEYKDQLVVKEIVKREVDDKVKVEESDIVAYYEANKADYVEPEKVTVTEITFEDEEKAEEVYKRITEGGEDFTALAKDLSDKRESVGPGQGNEGKATFSKDSFSQAKEFVEKSFSLEIGEMARIVQLIGERTYYMIFRLDERIPERQQELSEVRDRIENLVEREKKKELMNTWLEDLKAKRKFQIFADRIPEIPEEEAEDEVSEEEVETEQETNEADEN